MDRRKKRTSTNQYMMYIKMMEQDSIFASGKVPRDVDIHYLSNKWKDLSEQLNTCSNGPRLTSEEWRKRLNDWKNTTRCKYRRSQSGEKDISMTSLEMRALDLFGRAPNVSSSSEQLHIHLKSEKEDCDDEMDHSHRTSETFHKELQAAVDEAIGGEVDEEGCANDTDEQEELLSDALPATTTVVNSTSTAHNSSAPTYRTIVVENAAFTDDEHNDEHVEFISHRRATVGGHTSTNSTSTGVQTVSNVTKLINGEIPLKRLRTQTTDQIVYEVKKAPSTQQRTYTTTTQYNSAPTMVSTHYQHPSPHVENVKPDTLNVGGIFSSQDAREIARQLKRLADIKNEKLKFDIARFKFNNPGFQYHYTS